MTLCLPLNPIAAPNSKNFIKDIVKQSIDIKDLISSPIFEGRGDGETTCPVTGEKIINAAYQFEYAGRKVLFCCKGCYQRAKHNPSKYLKPTIEEQHVAVKAFIDKSSAVMDGSEVCDE